MGNESRIRERDLILPALKLIADYADPEAGLSVTEITQKLRGILRLSEADLAILTGRKDDRFSQVVRNLVSHRTLEKEGLAEYKKGGVFGRGSYRLTPKGRILIEYEQDQLDLFNKNLEK